MSSYKCTSCGAPIEVSNRFSKVVVCSYCDTHLKIKDNSLDISGKHHKLAKFPSIFELGTTGTILGKSFTVLGRMRYKYSGGFYDEWFLNYDNETAWFSEDEGTYTLYTEMVEVTEFPDITSIRVGQNINIDKWKVMVKEKGKATLDGGEGELLFYLEPGTEVTYIDGISEGKKISIEHTEEEIEFFIGRPVLKKDIVI